MNINSFFPSGINLFPSHSTLAITGSVGVGGVNKPMDVLRVRAVINVWLRSNGQPSLPMLETADAELSAKISELQPQQHGAITDGIFVPGGPTYTYKWLCSCLSRSFTVQSEIPPSRGLLTWHAEGHESGFFYTRKLQVPGNTSGLTLGRGYDMSERNVAQIHSDLIEAGVSIPLANTISRGAGLKGLAASEFIIRKDLLDFEISPRGQMKLFEKTYDDHVGKAKELSNDFAHKFSKGRSKIDWQYLDPRILELLTDLRYRGDYTSHSATFLIKQVINNDFESFKREIKDSSRWPVVMRQAPERFYLRRDYVLRCPTIPNHRRGG